MKPNKRFTPISPQEKQFLQHMVEHHQMAVVMSKDILKATDDTEIMSLAYSILLTQINEISMMKEMIRQRPVGSSNERQE